jgi:hypothetical protein
MIGLIYALVDPRTKEIRYCGKTAKAMCYRLANHRREARNGVNRHVCHWVRSVLEAGFDPIVVRLEEIPLAGLDRTEQIRLLNEAEKKWIAELKELGCDLTNATLGGDGHHGVPLSPERKDALIAASIAARKRPEIRERIRQAALARDPSTYRRGSDHQHFGKTRTFKDNETRKANIRKAWDDPEKRARQSENMKLHAMSAEEIRKQSERHRGEKNVNAKITSEIAVAIYQATGKQNAIARQFGVSPNIVNRIKKGRVWAHATGVQPST